MWRLPARSNDPSELENGIEDETSRDLNLFGVFSLGVSVAALTVLCNALGADDGSVALPLATVVLAAAFYGWNEMFWTKAPLISWDVIKLNGIWAIYLIQFFDAFSAFGVSQPPDFNANPLN